MGLRKFWSLKVLMNRITAAEKHILLPEMKILFIVCVVFVCPSGYGQQKTYCNPINIDYGYTPIPNFSEWGRHRATADPVIVLYKNDYYLFSTNQWGYWWSSAMLNWKFISKKFLRPWNKV